MRVYALVHLNACSFPKHKPLAPSYVHFCEVPLKPKSSAPNPKCETRRSGIALFTQSRPKPVCLQPNQSVAAVHFSVCASWHSYAADRKHNLSLGFTLVTKCFHFFWRLRPGSSLYKGRSARCCQRCAEGDQVGSGV